MSLWCFEHAARGSRRGPREDGLGQGHDLRLVDEPSFGDVPEQL